MNKIQELIEAGKKATQGEWKRPSLYNDYLFVTTDIGNVIADFNNKSTHHDKENADFTALAANTRTEIETLYTLTQEMAEALENSQSYFEMMVDTSILPSTKVHNAVKERIRANKKALTKWTEFTK